MTTDRDGPAIGSAAGDRAPTVLGAQRDTSAGDLPASTGRIPREHPRIPRHRISILDEIFNVFSATPRKLQ
ncbi:MAG: hypothetical protein Q8L49_11260 [Burkholderiaceae bacterium]|nr:hypothetical protein [Burkholderiaceae bacterium]